MDTGPPGEVLFSRFPTWGGGPTPGPPVAVPLVSRPDAFQFRRIGHCLAAIMIGLVGAVLGRFIAAEDARPNH
jgi:hypothetical protein